MVNIKWTEYRACWQCRALPSQLDYYILYAYIAALLTVRLQDASLLCGTVYGKPCEDQKHSRPRKGSKKVTTINTINSWMRLLPVSVYAALLYLNALKPTCGFWSDTVDSAEFSNVSNRRYHLAQCMSYSPLRVLPLTPIHRHNYVSEGLSDTRFLGIRYIHPRL